MKIKKWGFSAILIVTMAMGFSAYGGKPTHATRLTTTERINNPAPGAWHWSARPFVHKDDFLFEVRAGATFADNRYYRITDTGTLSGEKILAKLRKILQEEDLLITLDFSQVPSYEFQKPNAGRSVGSAIKVRLRDIWVNTRFSYGDSHVQTETQFLEDLLYDTILSSERKALAPCGHKF